MFVGSLASNNFVVYVLCIIYHGTPGLYQVGAPSDGHHRLFWDVRCYGVENPTGTLLWQHERFSHFTNKMAWVFWLQLVVWTIFQVGAVNVRSVSLF